MAIKTEVVMGSTSGCEERVEAEVRRLGGLREALEASGLGVAVVYGSGRHGALASNPCWYFSGVKQIGRDACLVVPVQGEPLLLTTPSWDLDRTRDQGWIADVVAVNSLAEALEEAAKERGWHRVPVGLVGLAVASASVAARIRAVFGDRARVADDLFQTVGRVHDRYGVALLKRAVEIADAGYHHARSVVRPGIGDHEVAGACMLYTRAAGAEDNFQFISGSLFHPAPRVPSGRILCEGDVVLAEISPSVGGQIAQICRTFVLGEPTTEQAESYAILQEAFSAGAEVCAPGAPLAEVARIINGVIARYGYGEYNRPPYMRSRGHALGLGALVPFDISEDSDVVLEAGMSFVLHPNQFFPHVGYFLCGDQVLIDDGGARVLSTEPAQLDSVSIEAHS